MTLEQEAQRARIVAARSVLEDALSAHDHVESDAGCVVCDDGKTRACPVSPDGHCHYETMWGRDSTVLLRDGTTVEVEEDGGEPGDICYFCYDCREDK